MSGVDARKPSWLKVVAPGGPSYTRIKGTLAQLKLHTVCQEAHCPNVGECWGEGTATVMILGDVCTRGCRFCAVASGHPPAVDDTEPDRVAQAVAELGLRYVVLTMVNRDDLPDGGASHVARTVQRLHELGEGLLVEALVGDFQGSERDIDTVLAGEPDVFAHNVEVVRRVTRRVRDARCDYDRSLEVLAYAKRRAPGRLTKSSVMVGVGETDEEVEACLLDLRGVGVDIVTLGQYLRPSSKHLPVDRYVTPEVFEGYRRAGEGMGFRFVASGPLVRSSYRAAEAFVRADRGASSD
jgi:lipoic acid synthetase